MKRFLIILLIFVAGQEIFAQKFMGALAFGGNLAQVDGDEVYGFKKIGLNVGAAAFLPFNEQWKLSLEIGFTQKGAYQKYPMESDPTKELPYYNLRLDYVEIPFLIHYEDRQIAMIGTGFSYGRLVGAKEIEWGLQTATSSRSGVYDISDWNWVLDVRIRLVQSLRLNFRYAYSLYKLRTREFSNLSGDVWTRDQYNNVLTLRLVYTFGEKINPDNINE